MQAGLGETIKQYRQDEGLSLRELAAKCELSHAYIASLENDLDGRSGKSPRPTVETLKALAKGMGMTLENLMGRAGYLVFDKQDVDLQDGGRFSTALADDPDLAEFWEQVKRRGKLRLLIKQIKDLDDSSIMKIVRVIRAIEEEEDKH